MFCRTALPSVLAITILLCCFAAAVIFEQDLQGRAAIGAESAGFDALAYRIFGGTAASETVSTTSSSDTATR